MLAIYKRELKSCFCSFVGFLFIGFTLFFPGLYFTVYGLFSGNAYYSYVVMNVLFLFLISVPILTMRVLAEEKKNKTDQLILTAPVSVGSIVIGKFLALVTVFAIPTLITCFYPMILSVFGEVPVAENFVSILGFFLYGVACIAIGIFVSSLTESQVIAAVLTFGILFLGYMMNAICGLISNTGNLLTKILKSFDLSSPITNLMNGTLDMGSVVYFLSLTALFLFLTVQSIQKRRYSVSVKHFSVGAYSGISVVIAIAITVLVNMVLSEMPSTWKTVDLTSQKIYSLTDQTKEFLKTLEEDVTIYVMVNEDNQDFILGQTLQRYDDLSDHITVEYVDPTVNPRFHTQFTSQSFSINSMIVVSEKRSQVVDANDIYKYSTQMAADYSSYSTEITGYDAEGLITSALAYVTAEDMPKLYITEGHGEYTLSTDFQGALDKANIEYETVNLMNYESIPEDAACLLINGPANDFNTEDADKIIDYLKQGGKVIAIASLTDGDLANYNRIFEYMGLKVTNGLVVEGDMNHYYQIPYYLLPDVKTSAYTSGIGTNTYVFAPFSVGLQIVDEEAEGLSYQTLLETSENSFAQLDISASGDFEKRDGDVDGPFAVAVEAVRTQETASEETDTDTAKPEAVMVAIGCEQLFTDEANAVVSGSNQLLFTNIAGKFCANEMNVSIPVKAYAVSNIILSRTNVIVLGVTVTIVLPLAFLVIGFIVWMRRRKR